MATRAHSTSPLPGLLDRAEIMRRIGLAREAAPSGIPKPGWRLLLAELFSIVSPAPRLARLLRGPLVLPRAAHPRCVMLLPGFATHPSRMRYLAETLEAAGHTVKRWGQGYNWGASAENFAILEQRLLDLDRRCGGPVVLVGWSLGGLFARELAKKHPGSVAKVITMGTPFSYSPRANHAWRLYQLIAGHRVDKPPVGDDMAAKPPVETVALWSSNDGVVHPRAACGKPGERDRAIALRCGHMGFADARESIKTIAREIDGEHVGG